MTVKVFAPAKINLTLHVTGQRNDGYHLIDSLVAFAPIGDTLTIADADALTLMVRGPEAHGVPTDMRNLVMQMAATIAPGQGMAITLEKNLPVASGIGGGSADAAAVYRGLSDHRNLNLNMSEITGLGADIAMCLQPMQQRAQGIGDQLEKLTFPTVSAILANPRVSCSTADVFKSLKNNINAPMAGIIPDFAGSTDFVQWLVDQRNDLEVPAMEICPEIGVVLNELRHQDDCQLARMSGSGATCFAIFGSANSAKAAKHRIKMSHPDWWLAQGEIGNCMEKSAPRIS